MEGLSIAIGVILVLIFIVIIIYAATKNKKKIDWPPPSYMKEIGGKCPDYWTYLGEDENNQTVCKNIYNVPINKLDTKHKCMQEGSNIVKFENYSSWPPTGEALNERCRWIKGCGERPKINASWIGMDKLCSGQGDIPEEPSYGCTSDHKCIQVQEGNQTKQQCHEQCKPKPNKKQKYHCKNGKCIKSVKGKYNSELECKDDCVKNRRCRLSDSNKYGKENRMSCIIDNKNGTLTKNECKQKKCIPVERTYSCKRTPTSKKMCIYDQHSTQTLDKCKHSCMEQKYTCQN